MIRDIYNLDNHIIPLIVCLTVFAGLVFAMIAPEIYHYVLVPIFIGVVITVGCFVIYGLIYVICNFRFDDDDRC